jgi:large subunit ribosomal protein L5
MPALQSKFKYTTVMAVPRLQKIVLSMGVGKAILDKKYLEEAVKEMTAISGQKPLVCKATKSVSNFKLREGQEIGVKVTLRGDRMFEFVDRLINLAIPQVKDFRGLNPKSFDGRGNYSMGLAEQSVFPEIDPAKIQWMQGLNIAFITTANTNEEAFEMLKLFGMPFREQ